jgi:hypothetical protein
MAESMDISMQDDIIIISSSDKFSSVEASTNRNISWWA